jgi:glycosyltransferase involved in cell wall biosynthesis
VTVPSVKKPSRLAWALDRLVLPRFLRSNRIDVFHATEFTSIPASLGTAVIAHVHDMIPFLFWKQYSRRIPADYRWALQLAKRRIHKAQWVITDSFHSKNDIVEMTHYPESRIRVVYFGPAGMSGPRADIEACGMEADVPVLPEGRPYFLYVGGTDFRKNLVLLVRAFGIMSEKFPDILLVLAGQTFLMKSLPEVAEIYREVELHRLQNRVYMPGFIGTDQLRKMYANSMALVFPSLYEGFGLPVLEAMNARTLVIAARTSSIPEILADTGIYFDPCREDSLVEAMDAVVDRRVPRQELIAKAAERAKQFSWETAAESIFQIYEELS